MLMLTAYIEVGAVERAAIDAALAAVIPATRAEDGCEALDRHLATPHMAEWMRIAGPRLKAAHGLVYDIASVTELRPK